MYSQMSHLSSWVSPSSPVCSSASRKHLAETPGSGVDCSLRVGSRSWILNQETFRGNLAVFDLTCFHLFLWKTQVWQVVRHSSANEQRDTVQQNDRMEHCVHTEQPKMCFFKSVMLQYSDLYCCHAVKYYFHNPLFNVCVLIRHFWLWNCSALLALLLYTSIHMLHSTIDRTMQSWVESSWFFV